MAKQDSTARTGAGAPTERPAEEGEVCTCGRPARTVFLDSLTGWCGIPDGGAWAGPCPFCGQPRSSHVGRCTAYQLRPSKRSEPRTFTTLGPGGAS